MKVIETNQIETIAIKNNSASFGWTDNGDIYRELMSILQDGRIIFNMEEIEKAVKFEIIIKGERK